MFSILTSTNTLLLNIVYSAPYLHFIHMFPISVGSN